MGNKNQPKRPYRCKLLARHRVFAEWRVAGLSQAKAALKAGYSIAKSRSKGCLLESRDDVQDYMADLREGLLDEFLQETEAGREILRKNKQRTDGQTLRESLALRIVRDDVHVAFGDREKAYGWEADGELIVLASRNMSRRDRRLVKEVTSEVTYDPEGNRTVKLKIKLEDRGEAKNRMMKWLGFTNKQELFDKLAGGYAGGGSGDDDDECETEVAVPSNGRERPQSSSEEDEPEGEA